MELTELSLAPSQLNNSSSESENNFASSSSSSRKRKFFSDHHLLRSAVPPFQTSIVDLHVKDPLPPDWEQCLDLESGKMYYLNRKTLRKSWNWPNVDQKLDLELNISPLSDCPDHHQQCRRSNYINSSSLEEYSKKLQASSSCSNNNMVALACLNCHLLVILSRSSPSCPNCKYVHSLPTPQTPQPKISPTKSLNTLSLLN
ncbi:hypothetical protein P3X46_010313 [Hevea brasiliensis]|uniref:Uncharacterized protein n=2 Tax=Hevea brasiliensis TaxID=3981 RepID=A0A6A6N7U2_HEVBR|nr:protein CURLY FLAG LEAF 1 [Hevea brasiliensis]KAF2322242.1 hypothetical protein GH714_009097 [Hevea brasiliensis]KAJ9178432.1 hypothetical protein P3X46_010313 [Hevea brasiliensis]